MMTYYGRVLRWSIPLTSVVAVVAVVICALMDGSKGAYSALTGVGVVAVFFAISLVVVGHFAKVHPMAMMVAALGSFVVKIVAFMVVLAVVRHLTVFNGRMLGFTALACILAWSASQVGVAMKLNLPYVEPDSGVSEAAAREADARADDVRETPAAETPAQETAAAETPARETKAR